MREKRENDLGRDPIGRLMVRLAVPAVVAQLVNALYNIVDRMYIGHMEGVGDLALTGLGITFPVAMFVSALSALAGMGGGSRAAIAMGAGKKGEANQILGNCTSLLVIFAVAVTILFQIFKEPMLYLFGASENTITYAVDYLGVYLWGSVSVLLALGLNNFISTQGFSTYAMATVLLGAATNIILDPIFIFGLNMGVKGAALATILAQTVSAVWVIAFLCGKKSQLKLRVKSCRLNGKILLPVMAVGVSPFIMQSTESLVNIALNSSLKHYGGDLYVGAATIASSVMMVLTMPFVGLSQGAQPIVGYNFGARQNDRVRHTFRLLLISGVICSGLGWAAVQLVPGVFVTLFNNKPELMEVTKWAMRIYFGCMFALGVQFTCQNTFVALGQAKISLFLALLRKVILLIPFVIIFPLILQDKVFAVFLAEPVADILAATTTGLMFAWQFPKILARGPGSLPDPQ